MSKEQIIGAALEYVQVYEELRNAEKAQSEAADTIARCTRLLGERKTDLLATIGGYSTPLPVDGKITLREKLSA